MNDYTPEILAKTDTGNSMAYWDTYYAVPTWQFEIGPESEADTAWAEALKIDREEFPPVHIHVSQYGRDCDGGHGYDYVRFPDESDNYTADDVSHHVEEERESLPGTFSLDKFWRNAVTLAMSFHPEYGGKLEIECDPGDTYDRRANWSNGTDEGYHAEELRMCTDPGCADIRPEVYDQYAQMMGY